ncbi:hypothetical protein CCHR01_09927 [Colletotrichum chrysophilum]|uniref:Uncharacterized protein n=1 Tax=Colletotrichum chrysophilum TaxID=1836956 RepID=A0AAD9AID4_9PEZI|nr:hypothetical protein CCHR01_09927 [Colletotrichum chrysophilum]
MGPLLSNTPPCFSARALLIPHVEQVCGSVYEMSRWNRENGESRGRRSVVAEVSGYLACLRTKMEPACCLPGTNSYLQLSQLPTHREFEDH